MAEGAARRPTRPLRADAVRNQRRLLEAAGELFAARGLGVSLHDVAEHAGLGVATLYRRFPDRQSLVEALFRDRVAATTDAALRFLEEADPYEGFVGLVRTVCEDLALDKGLREVVLSSGFGTRELVEERDRLVALVQRLLQRAQDAGVVRPDLLVTDVPLMFLAVGSVAEFGGEHAPQAWRRVLDLFVDGLSLVAGRRHLSPGLTPDDLDRVMAGYRPGVPARTSVPEAHLPATAVDRVSATSPARE